ncbi:MAG TPA: DUF6807 family protein [Candidatus Dormibacteraeota bacterium]|nr:DUF6807 family protein [Candidatus Dormibacteraeota bacterium]
MNTNLEHQGYLSPAHSWFHLLCCLGLFLPLLPASAVSWDRQADSIAGQEKGETLWKFSWSTNQGKPYFHPVRLLGGESLTALQPGDHPWHYGLWFSWKYINHVNYWEEDKKTHRAEGPTCWDTPKITKHDDGSAEIKMSLRYLSPTNGAVMMSEEREIQVSAPKADGSITLDWTGRFTAGEQPLVLDRTPMPGEEHGAVNGGYAGFSLRAAQAPATCEFLTTDGPITSYETNRARPKCKAAACNITQNNRTDGVAILSHVSNTGGDSTWYIINSPGMRWFQPALLAPSPKKVKPNDTFTWKFRVVTQATPWTPEKLSEVSASYNK